MKNLSLQDQLLKAGLTNDNKIKQVRAEKRKQTKKLNKNKVAVVDEAKQLAQEAKTKQIEKDKALNEQRNKEAEKKHIANQIIQLIELNKLPKDQEADIAYNFTDQNKVKVIYVSEDIRNKIIAGRLAVVKAKLSYEVVAVEVANKIKQRNESVVIVLFSEQADTIEDDEYQGYEIPDDLMW
ncbi:MAG: DUF2058 domain-containing protein [Methylococcales bacterium]|nr:DUF2058 domain-containing protein [Methylococcales bacterium]